MTVRKFGIGLLVALILAGSVGESKAVGPTPVNVAVAGGSSTGAAITGGFIVVIAVICAYDVWLKFKGFKNWDGTLRKGKKIP